MSGFDLFADSVREAANTIPTVKVTDPGMFDGFFRGTGMAIMREAFAKPARSMSMLGAVAPIAVDAITGGTTLQDKYFRTHQDVFDNAVKFWTPQPGEVGTAAELTGGLIGTLGQIVLSPHLAVSNQILSQGEDLVTQPGVSAGQALAVGIAQGAGLGVGIWAPPALGYNLVTKAATGAGVNLLQGIITRGASAAILGDNPAARNFPAFGGEEMLFDVLLGAAFGTAAHYVPRWKAETENATTRLDIAARGPGKSPAEAALRPGARAVQEAINVWSQNVTPTEQAALATMRVAKHLNADSMPGRPTGPASVEVHVAAMREAIQSLLTDQPVTARVTNDDGSPIQREPTQPATRDMLAQARQELEQGQPGAGYQELLDIMAEPPGPRRAELLGNLRPDLAQAKEAPADPEQASLWAEIHQPDPAAKPTPIADLEAAVRAWNPESQVFHVKQPPLFTPEQTAGAEARLTALEQEAARIAAQEGLPGKPLDPIDTWVEREVRQAGRPPEESQAAGAMWKAAFESFGKAAGVDPTQLFYRYMDRVIGYGAAQPDAATTLMQAGTRPANNIEAYAPQVIPSQRNRIPQFRARDIAMIKPDMMLSSASKGKRASWLIYSIDANNKATKVGYVIADYNPADNTFHALRRIEVDDSLRGTGIGERTIAMMLRQNNGKPMEVHDIVHAGVQGTKDDALPFWKKLGIRLDNYSSNPDIQMDGRMTLADYLGARGGQGLREGRAGDAAQAVPADGAGSRGGGAGAGGGDAGRLFQSPTGRWYYSALSAAIDAAPPRAQNAGTWKQWLQAQINAGRIKETEVELSGIREFLDAQEGTIPPDQLRAYMEQVGETNALFQRAGHMSPHTFDQFDHSHISRGEGAQVYGWGTYLWTNRAVGDWYYNNFERAAQRDASITIREGPLDTKWMGPNSKPTAEAKKLFTEEQLVAMSAFDEEIKKDDHIVKAYQRAESRIRQALDPDGRRSVKSAKAIAWLSDLITIDMAARKIGVNNDPAYKTPDGRMVHASMQGAAKSLADAIAQVETYGYERAAQTFDNLIKQAASHAKAQAQELQPYIDDERRLYAAKIIVEPISEPGKSKWGAMEPQAREYAVRYEAPDGSVLRNGDTFARRSPEEAAGAAKVRIDQAIAKWQQMIDGANERVAELQRTRQLVDDITQPDTYKLKKDGDAWHVVDQRGEIASSAKYRKSEAQHDLAYLNSTGSRSLKPGYEKVQPQIKKPRHYTVEAPENDILIDWSKRVSEQPKPVLEALERGGIKVITSEDIRQQAENLWAMEREILEEQVELAKPDDRQSAEADLHAQLPATSQSYRLRAEEFIRDNVAEQSKIPVFEGESGRDLYVEMMRQFGYHDGPLDGPNTQYAAQASEAFAKMGIPGHRYLDGSSRRRGEGTYNLVIYDDKAMQIVHMEQTRERGFLQIGDERKMLIGLGKDADASTFMHESAHFFLEVMDDLSTTVPALKADMEVLFKEWGIDRAAWDQMDLNGKRPYHEMFAESFEVYLMTNKAPTPELRSVFQRFRDWLLDIYQVATATGRKVSQPMRDLFDRMLDAQRRETTTTRAAQPTEGTPPPPRPEGGEPPGVVDPFDFETTGEPQPPAPLTLDDQGMREMIREAVEKESGWYQIGGRHMGGEHGVPNFSEWIPNGPWWVARPDKKLNAQGYINAVAKALVGDKLKPIEQRAVQYLLDHLNQRRVDEWKAARQEWDQLSAEVAAEGLQPTPENVIDANTVARAAAIDEAMVERLAMQYDGDDVGFMAEIRRMIDAKQNPATVQGGEGSQAAAPEAAQAAAVTDGRGDSQPAAGRQPDAAREAADDPLAREADRVAVENPAMVLQFDQPDGTVVRMTAAQYLEQARMEAELARQDKGLLITAAECMLGAMT